ncbi:MAG: CoA pyrophosphatase [Pseudomonadota bacterium]
MRLRDALQHAVSKPGAPSSDYDLNADAVLPERTLREAGVLVAIVDDEVPRVILTKRSSALKHHPGQISFPGGKVEESDAHVVEAALREAEEEISLTGVDVVGHLAPHETVTGFNVTPVVGLVQPGYSVTPDEREVAEAFDVPLDHLLSPQNYMIESRLWRGQPRYFFTVPWGPYYIWGATARILRALADRMADAND